MGVNIKISVLRTWSSRGKWEGDVAECQAVLLLLASNPQIERRSTPCCHNVNVNTVDISRCIGHRFLSSETTRDSLQQDK